MRHALIFALALAGAASAEDAPPRPHTALPNVRVLDPLPTPGTERTRTLRVYLPPGYESSLRRYPVIYMHDGQNLFDDATSYVGEWGVDEAMEELAKSTGFEAIVIGVDHGGERRILEMSPFASLRFGPGEGEQYLAFIVDVVKPYIDRQYRTKPGREATAIMGSSMGGLISHYAILRYPGVFSKAGVLSPAYWINPEITQYTRDHPPPSDARVYLYAGGKEGAEMVDGMNAMELELRKTMPRNGQLAAHLVAENEHNEKAWRGEFPRVVRWLFGLKAK
jgi:predicted alpha/beta superfamily hydrolase